jgi:hypothetical protein
MAFSLNKAERARHGSIAADLSISHQAVVEALAEWSAAVEAATAALRPALESYNTTLADAREFAEDVKSQAEQDISEKSEKWQESERGKAAQEWADLWGAWAPDDFEIAEPEEIEPPSEDEIEAFAELPSKPGSDE